MRNAWRQGYKQRLKDGWIPREKNYRDTPAERQTPPKPMTWWVAQAMGIMETCERCEGPVEGVYVSPTVENMGECAVVAHCRLCGRERMVLSGRMGVPYERAPDGQPTKEPSTHVRPPGQPIQTVEQSRAKDIARKKVWKETA